MTPEEKLKNTVFFVEANNFEKLFLWKENRDRKEPLEWIQDCSGFMHQVGEMISNEKKLPVCVEFSFATINGKHICFFNACSRVVDHEMVENFITNTYPVTYHNGSRRAICDARNFHQCLNFCKE